MAEFKKGAVLTFSTLLIVLNSISLLSTGWAEATIIKRIRTGSEHAYVRVVIETNTRIEPRPKISVNRKTLQISLDSIEKDLSTLKSEAYRNDVVNVDVTGSSEKTNINATLAFVPTRVRTFFLIDPHRFVIDAYRPSSKDTSNLPSEELQSISIIEENGTGPNDVDDQTTSPQKKERIISRKPQPTVAIANSNANGSNREGLQQRILVFLIVVTSIILIVIIFLMCMDRQQK